ncbi:MAG: OmpA family protein [Desulfobacterales bacterium]|jgi:outer membrane protein OmpA-like peptidoglycan-associated protein
MKRLFFPCAIIVVFLAASTTYAGFDFLNKVKESVQRKLDQKVDDSIDKGVDETEKVITGEGKEGGDAHSTSGNGSSANTGQSGGSASSQANQAELKAWSKYDFVPGDEIIFYDDLQGEENGEFPSRWDLKEGNVEVAVYDGQKVINFATDQKSGIVPLMKKKGDYLPEKFTIEFDAYFSEFCTAYTVRLYDEINQRPQKSIPFVRVRADDVGVEGFGSTNISRSDYPYWEHIAISFNTRALKVYFGKQRVMNIPNLRAEPMGITIESRQCHRGKQALIKDIRIAKGAKKLYDRIMTDGKIVTRGILFDVNKATLKPESMGVINEIAKMMKEHGDLKLSVEGHTDSDGEKAFNQKLSEQRADAVKDALVDAGVDASRLQTKGFGESKPVSDNATAEGKANNRRVEFVKI